MFDAYKKELYENRLIALDMPIETDNGFNVERETLIDDIEDFFEGETREENRIKVNGTWYDYYGDLVSNKRRVASPVTTAAPNTQSVMSNKR